MAVLLNYRENLGSYKNHSIHTSKYASMNTMSKYQKLTKRIEAGQDISFSEALKLLVDLGYTYTIKGSHHTFRKPDYQRVTIVKRNPIHRDAVQDIKTILEGMNDEQ